MTLSLLYTQCCLSNTYERTCCKDSARCTAKMGDLCLVLFLFVLPIYSFYHPTFLSTHTATILLSIGCIHTALAIIEISFQFMGKQLSFRDIKTRLVEG